MKRWESGLRGWPRELANHMTSNTSCGRLSAKEGCWKRLYLDLEAQMLIRQTGMGRASWPDRINVGAFEGFAATVSLAVERSVSQG